MRFSETRYSTFKIHSLLESSFMWPNFLATITDFDEIFRVSSTCYHKVWYQFWVSGTHLVKSYEGGQGAFLKIDWVVQKNWKLVKTRAHTCYLIIRNQIWKILKNFFIRNFRTCSGLILSTYLIIWDWNPQYPSEIFLCHIG